MTMVMNEDGVEGGGCMHVMSCVETPAVDGGDGRFPVGKKVGFKDVEKREKEEKSLDPYNSDSESSSIGKNSDVSEKSSGNFDENEEVQSSYKGPLDAMNALEEVLPMRRGISRFYNGKSKSFASLIDASSSSIRNILKPENAYTRKRRNLIASCVRYFGHNFLIRCPIELPSGSLKTNGLGNEEKEISLNLMVVGFSKNKNKPINLSTSALYRTPAIIPYDKLNFANDRQRQNA